jgi:hypothetical protein
LTAPQAPRAHSVSALSPGSMYTRPAVPRSSPNGDLICGVSASPPVFKYSRDRLYPRTQTSALLDLRYNQISRAGVWILSFAFCVWDESCMVYEILPLHANTDRINLVLDQMTQRFCLGICVCVHLNRMSVLGCRASRPNAPSYRTQLTASLLPNLRLLRWTTSGLVTCIDSPQAR